MQILVITMSDRASSGEYTDRSGPRAVECLSEHFNETGIAFDIATKILPDDAGGLQKELNAAFDANVHVIVTTGGTGVGPRDNTTDVILELVDKVIPGIMEAVRMKYAIDKPCALLSRTVAATKGSTMVYALPGSTKGVQEYLGEVLKSLDHLLCVLHQLDVH